MKIHLPLSSLSNRWVLQKEIFMKHIISCSDGTWNKPVEDIRSTNNEDAADADSDFDTNVARMYKSICSRKGDVEQVKIYDQGVGTGIGWKDKIVGGSTGEGIDKNIKDVYQFFMLNYQPGDKLFLFGFSRGAYTARSVAGFMRNCGILKPENINLVDKAYEFYRDRNPYTHPDSDLMNSFRNAYCLKDETGSNIIPIYFIGVWDTVGALGVPLSWFQLSNRKRYRFHDVTLSSHVRHAYHALAVDEKRALFSPTLWQKSKTVQADPGYQQNMEQRWFAGVHSNVGGGYIDSGLSNIALRWLMDKASGAGLCFTDNPLVQDKEGRDNGLLEESRKGFYKLWRPAWRPIKKSDALTNQEIDESVFERMKNEKWKYHPKNLADLSAGE